MILQRREERSWTRGGGIELGVRSRGGRKEEELEARHRRGSSMDRSRVRAGAAAAEGGAGAYAAVKR